MSSKDRHRDRIDRSRSPHQKETGLVNDRRRSPSPGRRKVDNNRQRERHKDRRKDKEPSRRDDVSPERRERNKKDDSHPQENVQSLGRSQEERDNRENKQTGQSDERHKVGKKEFLGDTSDNQAPQSKEQPNFELSGKLAEYTNTYKGVVIKYNEPPEALKPKTRWRLYPFKGDHPLSVMYIHRQSAYLVGRQRHVVDLAVDHPSCSKQHAVLQYRLVNYEREDGSTGRKCKPYIIDLESANGTFLNNQKIEARRYYELKEKDVLKFGFSTREYVLLNEKTKEAKSDIEDDVTEETEEKD